MDIIDKLSAKLSCRSRSETGHYKLTTFEDIVQHLLEQLRKNETNSFQEFFDCVEQELIFGDRAVQDSLIVHLLEALKNHASMRDVDYAIFENWLGPETHVAWRWLEKKWQGKTSLADSASGI